MTLAARRVLGDCSTALKMMEVETDPNRLREQWIGAMALIRLVGHVLKETDGKNPRYQRAVQEHWKYLSTSKDPTFWRFIKDSRDRAVKRYDTDLPPNSVITVGVPYDGELAVFTLDECMLMPLEGGWRAGEDARDVYRDAIEWWDHDLEEIEAASDGN